MKDDNKIWKEVDLPPLSANTLNLGKPETTKKATVDIRAVKFILEDEDGYRRIKFHDGEVLGLDSSYKLEIF